MSEAFHVVSTAGAPAAIGPYSQAVTVPLAGGAEFIFCSGQIPLDPATGQIAAGAIDSVAVATQRVLDNLAAVLAAAGAGFEDVVKTTVYLADMAHFPAMNEVYGRAFAAPSPARSTIAAKELPRGVLVEIDAIAVRRPFGT